jgi:polyhydroxyalkanoate synthesis regulator phasin
MDQSDDPKELERKIEQAVRIASSVTDQTTVQRLTAFVDDLKHQLMQIIDGRRNKHEIRSRAREIWEQNGRPSGRDEEFWLQAETEIRARNQL